MTRKRLHLQKIYYLNQKLSIAVYGNEREIVFMCAFGDFVSHINRTHTHSRTNLHAEKVCVCVCTRTHTDIIRKWLFLPQV